MGSNGTGLFISNNFHNSSFMNRILTIGFEFHEIFYYSLIRVKKIAGETQYRITVINKTLQRLLFGNNIIKEKNGHLNIEVPEDEKKEELKLTIAEALSRLLNMPLEKELSFDKFY